MDRFGDLKKQIKERLLVKKDELLQTLLKRLEVCGHCNGLTYEDGTCVDHFTE